RALPAAGVDEHVDVIGRSAAARERLIDAWRIGALDEEERPRRRHRATAVAQDRRCALAVPVVDDVLQEIAVAAGRSLREEVAADRLAARGETAGGDLLAGAGGRVLLIEDNAVQMRMRVENADQQRAVPATDVDDRAQRGEIVI